MSGMTSFSWKRWKYLTIALIGMVRSKYNLRSFDKFSSYFYNERNTWIELYLELFIVTMISHHLINCRTFSLNYQNNWKESWFEFFTFQTKLDSVIKTNLCFGLRKITECTTLLFIIHQLYNSCVATIQIFVQKVLIYMNKLWLELFIFHRSFNCISNTNLCFEASKIVEHKHPKKNWFVIRSWIMLHMQIFSPQKLNYLNRIVV